MLLANSFNDASSKCLRGLSGLGSIDSVLSRVGRLNGISATCRLTRLSSPATCRKAAGPRRSALGTQHPDLMAGPHVFIQDARDRISNGFVVLTACGKVEIGLTTCDWRKKANPSLGT